MTAATTQRRPVPWGRVTLLAVLLLEVVTAIAVSDVIGVAWTLVALGGLSVLGGWILVLEGRRGWTSLTTADPNGVRTDRAGAAAGLAREAPRTATGVAAGILLTVPGFVTAIAGGVLLIPPVRRFAGRRLEALMVRRRAPAAGNVVLGEIVVSDVQVSDLGGPNGEEPGPSRGPGSTFS